MNPVVQASTPTCKDPVRFDQAMKLIGDFWTLRVIDALQGDEVRFCEIERRVPDINPSTLTARLKRLEESGVIRRQVETKDRQSVTYSLTTRGLRILPIIEAIKAYTKD